MEKKKNFNKKQRHYLPILSSENSAIDTFKRKEDSRKSSERVSFSDNYSISGSSKGIKDFNFNKNHTKDKSGLNSKKIFLNNIDFSGKKLKENLKNKLLYQTKYSNIFNTTNKENKLKKSDFFILKKPNNLFCITKKTLKSKNTLKEQKNKYNISILQKFNKDIKKYLMNSLDNSKDEIKKTVTKLNKTFYQKTLPISNKSQSNIKNDNNSEKSEKSKRSTSNYSIKSKENNIENKILKTKYSSHLIKINKYYERKRNFRQYIEEKKFLDKDWNTKIGIAKSNIEYNHLLANDINFQSRVIKDELCVLVDDIQYYRLTFLGNNDLYSSFKNMPLNKQVKLNKILEESCALLHYIPKIILKEYNKFTDKFISIDDPSKEMFSKKYVYNELETFQENLKYLYKISNFVKCCGEVYSQLIKQVEEEMAITVQNFFMLREILKRIRFYIIDLTNISKNILINYCFDKYIMINKFKKVIKQAKVEMKRINTESKARKMFNKKYRLKGKLKLKKASTVINSRENIKKQNDNINDNLLDIDDEIEGREKMVNVSKTFGKNKNYVWDKMMRIKKALELNNIYDKVNINNGKDKSKYKKKEVKPMACINSVLMTKMLKYIDKDIKGQIISLRTSERHHNYENED